MSEKPFIREVSFDEKSLHLSYMKKEVAMKRSLFLFLITMVMGLGSLMAQSGSVLITGIVKDKETRRELVNANVSVRGTSIGTVSNADGVFSIKVSEEDVHRGLVISHIGYRNAYLTVEELTAPKKRLSVWMTPSTLSLNEINVFGGDPLALVEQAIRKIPVNYADKDNMFSAFYRETIQKRNRYIGISEAVLDVYKTDYKRRDVSYDKVQLLKGRRLASQKKSDTLAVKIVGGPTIPINMDVVKNNNDFLGMDLIYCYRFSMQIPVSIDNRMQYVIRFVPAVDLDFALFKGMLYIDQETLAITRAEFQLDMSDKDKAVRAILRKKPAGLRFRLQEVNYLVTYRYLEGKSYLNYLRNEIRFKCDWKRRLFASTFTTTTEMVMVDRTDDPEEGIRRKDSFRPQEIFYDMVDEYWNEDFWKDYNIIEPTESLESAVKKLKKKQ